MALIKVLAEDIRTTRFFDSHDCAITRALKRAGFADYEEAGGKIYDDRNSKTVLSDKDNKVYHDMLIKVIKMYGKSSETLEPEDFEVELPL